MNNLDNRPSSFAQSNTLNLDGKTQVGGLDYKTAALLCYLPVCAINLIASIVFLKTEPQENKFVRFHAMQSLVMCVGFIIAAVAVNIVSAILFAIPFIGFLGWGLHIAFLGVCLVFLYKSIMAMIDASKGGMSKIAYFGDFAEQRLQ